MTYFYFAWRRKCNLKKKNVQTIIAQNNVRRESTRRFPKNTFATGGRDLSTYKIYCPPNNAYGSREFAI